MNIVEWLGDQALGTHSVGDSFGGLVKLLQAEGVPLGRAHLQRQHKTRSREAFCRINCHADMFRCPCATAPASLKSIHWIDFQALRSPGRSRPYCSIFNDSFVRILLKKSSI